MRNNKRKGRGGANWMDTYGDMVTLLLCFFVMLFALSTIDAQKWQQIVQSFNPSAIEEKPNEQPVESTPPDTELPEKPSDDLTQEEIDQNIEELYQAMQQYVQENGLSDRISLGKGNGYVFISFADTVFFNGDSYVLLDEGKQVLDKIALSVGEVSSSIDEIRIMGHTAQAHADEENNPTTDRFLASNRATVVTVYLQEKNIIDPARLVSVGYGQWRPVSPNDIEENRKKNRRVEMIVTGIDLDGENGDNISQYYALHEQMNENTSDNSSEQGQH